MKVIRGEGPEIDQQTGKKKIMVELDEDDIIYLGDAIRTMIDEERFDKDDARVLAKLNQLKNKTHEAFTIVRPS